MGDFHSSSTDWLVNKKNANKMPQYVCTAIAWLPFLPHTPPINMAGSLSEIEIDFEHYLLLARDFIGSWPATTTQNKDKRQG